MSPMLFIMRKTLKNLIKGVFKKPILFIGYLFIALFVVTMLIASFAMPSGLIRSGSSDLYIGIITIVFLFMYYTTLKLGVDKGSTYFRAADVNLAFTAPIKPNHILLYGFIKQLGGTVLFLFFALCQIPNLKNNFEMEPYGTWMILLATIMYTLSYPLISMVLYSWATKKDGRKKLLKRSFDVLALAIAVLVLLSLARTRNITETLGDVFNNQIAKYFPVIGWTSSIAIASVKGFTTEFWVGLIGMLSLILGAAVTLYNMNLDYYEDVLESTEYFEAARKAKKEGRNMTFGVKVKDRVKQKLSGTGASTIFYKQLLELRKTAYVLFFDRSSVTVIIAAIMFRLVIPDNAQVPSLLMILFFALYMLLLLQVQCRIGMELEKHYIFLIPASSYEKLFFATLGEHIKNLFDGIVLFVLSGILFKAPLVIVISCIITYTLFGAVYTYSDVLTRRLFGRIHSKAILFFVKVLINLLIIVPGGIAAGIVIFITQSEFFMICALAGWSFVLVVTLFMFTAGILNNLETVS
ncbi:MAG TPA: ABC transporter permease [Clostridiaceae bacterium]|jgi:hypothetical protein|nr:ABC transporter permease [Clostridiaceae bacterium]